MGHGRDRDLVQANRLFEKACDGDNYGGCQRLAEHTRVGRGVTQNPERAASLYQKACDGGALGACTAQGLNYRYGHTVTRDHAKANALFRRACDGGHASGCVHLGVSYEYGMGVETDVETAKTLYTQAFKVRQTSCNTDGGACERWLLAQLFERGWRRTDAARAQAIYREALSWLSIVAGMTTRPANSQAESMHRGYMADLSEDGIPTEKACTRLESACAYQGDAVRAGVATSQVPQTAIHLYAKACRDGSGYGCYQLGETHRLGRDTPTDITQAASAFERGCETLGEPLACLAWGTALDAGLGVKRSSERALSAYDRACQYGRLRLSKSACKRARALRAD